MIDLTSHENKWIRYQEEASPPDRKTVVVQVINLKSDRVIGRISWYSAWRQYCYYAVPFTILSEDCMNDIADAIQALMEARA